MKKVNLKYDENHNVFNGLINESCTIVSVPQEITDVIGSSMTTFSFNIQLKEEIVFVVDGKEMGKLNPSIFTIQARGGQYDPNVHKLNSTTFINVAWKIGEKTPFFSASTISVEQQNSSLLKADFVSFVEIETILQNELESQITN